LVDAQLAVLTGCVGVDGAIAGIAFGPDEQEQVVAGGVLMHLVGKFAGGLSGFAVHFKDDVARLEAGVFSGAAGADLLDDDAMDMFGDVQLLPGLGEFSSPSFEASSDFE
jgi:hypothetical protein